MTHMPLSTVAAPSAVRSSSRVVPALHQRAVRFRLVHARASVAVAMVLAAGSLALVACSSDTGASPTDGGASDSSVDGGATPPTPDGSTTPDGSAVGTSYVYSSQPSAAGADAVLTLLNAQGAQGRAYIGPYLGGGLPTAGVELFLRPTPTITLAYVREAAPRQTPEAFVAQLDAQGARGFAFKGPLLLGVGTELVFVKNAARGVTYTYATAPSSDDATATLRTLDEQGAKGFTYLTDYITDDSQPAVRVRVFQKVVGAPATTYRYALSTAPTDRAAAEAELTTRGQTGGVWRGAMAFGATSSFLFETASTTGTVKYAIEDEPGGDTNAMLTKLNARGAEGYFYLGPYLLGGKSTLVLMQGPPTALALTGTVLP